MAHILRLNLLHALIGAATESQPFVYFEGYGPTLEAGSSVVLSSADTRMGGCQNYGPFLDPYHNTHLLFRVPKKGP